MNRSCTPLPPAGHLWLYGFGRNRQSAASPRDVPPDRQRCSSRVDLGSSARRWTSEKAPSENAWCLLPPPISHHVRRPRTIFGETALRKCSGVVRIPRKASLPCPLVRPNANAKLLLQMDRRNIAFLAQPYRPRTP